MNRTLYLAIGFIAFILLLRFALHDPEFDAFAARRTDWHMRCDRYVGPISDADRPKALACKAELDELTAFATRKGWR